MGQQIKVSLFGTFEVAADGRSLTGFDSDKVRALLAYLAVEASVPHRREKLAGLLWPDFPERSARTNLRRALSNLRQVIGDKDADPTFLIISRQTIQFNLGSRAEIDVNRFQELIKGRGDHVRALEEVGKLYRGAFLEGFSLADSSPFEEWQLQNRESLQLQAIRALQRLARIYEQEGQIEAALQVNQRLIELDPYQEENHRQLMRLLMAGGRRSDALAQFDVLEDLLAKELAVEPEPETAALYDQILSGAGGERASRAARKVVRGYELQELLGKGQFGAVYRAHQPGIGRDVAMKVILPQYADDPQFIRRFEVEAQLVARLEHPSIVPLYDYWREPGSAFLVMRWLRGGSLQSALTRGPLEPEQVEQLVDQIAGALHTAHRQGVVHRDIKPANILLDEDGNAYLSDFGIAKDVLLDPELTRDGTLVGTPGYLAPEQILQEAITPAADIYSLGIVLYESLTGVHPFPDAEVGTVVGKHLAETVPPVSGLRPDLADGIDAVIQKATAKNPDERYIDALALAAAYRAVVSGGETLEVVRAAETINPYKGLRAFREADAADFFGREALVEELLELLSSGAANGRFLAVVGPSGSGKSSVIRAGVVPALRKDSLAGSCHWFIAEMIPGSHPFEELEASLLRIAINPPESLLGQLKEDKRGLLRAVKRVLPGDEETELLLIVDQFEELFTLLDNREERQLFLDSLQEAVSDPRGRFRLIITLRADFYDRPLNYAGFGELVRRHTAAIVPLTAAELGSAITAPATNVGVDVEPELMATIQNDVRRQPGALPLLQYALTELFERRQNQLMTLNTYQEMGGVAAAVGRRAEEIYQDLDLAGQEAARQLFLRLVALGEGVEDTRRRVLRSELEDLGAGAEYGGSSSPFKRVIDEFGRYRLLTFDRDPLTRGATVEVAHEALFREWDRLQGWLEESWSDLIRQRQLRRAATEWMESGGEDESFLLRGERLVQFERWAEDTNLVLTIDERAFLGASIVQREEQLAAERERQDDELRLEQRAKSRLRALVIVGTLAFIVVAGLTISTIFLAQEQRLAETLAQFTLARNLIAGAQTNLERDPELSALLAIKGVETLQGINEDIPLEVESLLHQVAQAESISHTFRLGGPLTFSPDGQMLAVGSAESLLRIWDPLTGEDVWGAVRYQGRNQEIGDLAFSPDGLLLATASPEGYLKIWDVPASKEIGVIEREEGFKAVAFSPDGRQLLAAGGDGDVRLWDLSPLSAPIGKDSGLVELGESRIFAQFSEAAVDIIYSADGQRLALSVPEIGIILFDAQYGQRLLEISVDSDSRGSTAFSPNGQFLAAQTGDQEVTVWGAKDGTEVLNVNDGAAITHVAFSPDGRYLATATNEGKTTLWDMTSGGAAVTLAGHEEMIIDMAFHPGSRQLATSAADGFTRIWDLNQAGSELFTIFAHEGQVYDVLYNDDGSKFASAGDDGQVKLWAAETGELLHELPGPVERMHFPEFSPDGKKLAVAGQDSGAILWDTESGQELLALESSRPLIAMDFSEDGTKIAGGGEKGLIHLWDASSGEKLLDIDAQGDDIKRLLFVAPNVINAWDQTGLITAWDIATGDYLGELQCVNDIQIDADLSDDGRLIAAACNQVFLAETVDVPRANEYLYSMALTDLGEPVSIAFNPEGSLLAIASSAGDVTLWDTGTGRRHMKLSGPLNTLDNTIRQGGKQGYGTSYAQDSRGMFIGGIDISPDGRYLATASSDGTIKVYIMSLEELLEGIRSRQSRDFTNAECQEFFNLPKCAQE